MCRFPNHTLALELQKQTIKNKFVIIGSILSVFTVLCCVGCVVVRFIIRVVVFYTVDSLTEA